MWCVCVCFVFLVFNFAGGWNAINYGPIIRKKNTLSVSLILFFQLYLTDKTYIYNNNCDEETLKMWKITKGFTGLKQKCDVRH